MLMSSLRGMILATLFSRTLAYNTASSGATPQATPTNGASSAASTVDVDNVLFATYTLVILASVVGAIAIYRIALESVRYIRTLACLNNNTQNYFLTPNKWYSLAKTNLLYAPLFRRRHLRELHIFRSWPIGVLPTRFQSLFLVGLIGTNITLCVTGIEWDTAGSQNMMNHLRNRTGTLAVVNLIPLIIMGGRNNPLIKMLNIPFDTFNLMHRWFGRIVVAEAVAHTVTWTVKTVHSSGWEAVQKSLESSQLIITGTVATVAMLFIVLQSSALIRHAFYETFLHLHIALIMLTLIFLYKHLDGLPQLVYLQISIAAWATERFIRLSSLIYRNFGFGQSSTVAIVEPLPGDALRLTINMARPWTFKPGQHMFVTLPSVGLWTSHPFSIAWSDTESPSDEKDRTLSIPDILSEGKTTMSAVIRRRDGFTNTLYKKAENAQGRLVLNALVEGPYGGLHDLASYGTVMIFAGGVGITHQLPHVRHLVTGFSNGTVATRRVTLVWIIQSPEHLEWIRPWMSSILALDRRREILRIQLFVTRPRSTREIHSPSATVQMFPGRPNVDTLIEMESRGQIGAMGVSVCGTAGLADDVRRAVRKRGDRNVDFVQESYSW